MIKDRRKERMEEKLNKGKRREEKKKYSEGMKVMGMKRKIERYRKRKGRKGKKEERKVR